MSISVQSQAVLNNLNNMIGQIQGIQVAAQAHHDDHLARNAPIAAALELEVKTSLVEVLAKIQAHAAAYAEAAAES
jgi:hypothetical protein